MKVTEENWKDQLTQEELNHLEHTANVTTLEGCKRTFEFQAELRKGREEVEPCWECKFIAQKLGFPV